MARPSSAAGVAAAPPGSAGTGVDRLSALLERFRVRAQLFHAGPLCGVTHFAAQPGRAFLHVLRRGEMEVRHRARSGAPRRLLVREPTLLFYPRPLAHDFHNAPREGSDFVCATLDFDGGPRHPLVQALPPFVALPIAEVDGIEQTLQLLFAETERLRCGQRLLADRLFEVLLLQMLRWLLDHPACPQGQAVAEPTPRGGQGTRERPFVPCDQGGVPAGLLAGLSHPKLARALTAVHEQPGADWSLPALAREAGMSRSAFAATFKAVLGQAPGDYLLRWRMALAQTLLRDGASVKTVGDALGYTSAAAFSRAFSQVAGVSPRAWRQGAAAG